MKSETRQLDLHDRIRLALEEDRRGEAHRRLTLFKCACVRLTLPAAADALDALDATERLALGRITRAEQREVVNGRFSGAQTVVMGLKYESPRAATAIALDSAVHASDLQSIRNVMTMCLAWAQFTAKKFGEDTSVARGEMEAAMLDALDRILEARSLEEAAIEVRLLPVNSTGPVN